MSNDRLALVLTSIVTIHYGCLISLIISIFFEFTSFKNERIESVSVNVDAVMYCTLGLFTTLLKSMREEIHVGN